MKFKFIEQLPKLKKFEDFREMDLLNKDFRDISVDVLRTIDFDSQTKWPKDKLPFNFDPEEVLENSKNPGLGIKKLHDQGIAGKGINVAIIDQKLDTNHSEYSNALRNYEEIGEVENEFSMHGPGVCSLFVGKNCGIAPESKFYYKATPSGKECNWDKQAEALNKIINDNNSLPDENKIKIVSCSLGYPNPDFSGNLNNWKNSINEARKNGIIFVDSNTLFESGFIGGGSFGDKNDFDTYEEWLFTQENKKNKKWAEGKIIIPSDYRTIASSWNKKNRDGIDEYAFYGQGGVSWSIPYLAGLFTLMLQINIDLKIEEMVKILKDTSITNINGLKIIDPQKAMENINK
jgi:serine protease AprX